MNLISEYSDLHLNSLPDPTDSMVGGNLPAPVQYEGEQYLEDGAEPVGYIELPDSPAAEPDTNVASIDGYFRDADGKLWRRWTY